ncbi:hypothetical protein [Prosthecomicrobium pneumaticum]|uniref:Uncharacterized protein n=1 Tax=Prosthecomicrobium pneumaticum TaxID=81895 RepID=A0A7W9FPF5_9HYPH|nr:hypothetical protein [Prosthecomicrobium pneumaticum]MBB5754346.1 hypothetical protein [Prosthecomicrobium pneumaticum]
MMTVHAAIRIHDACRSASAALCHAMDGSDGPVFAVLDRLVCEIDEEAMKAIDALRVLKPVDAAEHYERALALIRHETDAGAGLAEIAMLATDLAEGHQ